MKTVKRLCVFMLICATFGQDIKDEEKHREEGRELRDYNQDWKAVDYFPPNPDTSGWIPQPQGESEEQTPRRRRIRKRKRRPPVLTIIEEENEETFSPSRRKVRPQRLDRIKEPWEEMSEETNQKSYNRRRLTPVFDETEEVTEPKIVIYEKIRDPFTALQEAEEKQKKKVEESAIKTPDLKTLLKQSEGLSLSEVLQQKNLSLSELLKGDRQAISVLAGGAETEEITTTTESAKYKRLPPSVGLKQDINRNFDRSGESNERLSSHEVADAQRKRLSLLHKDSKLFPDVTKVDVITEATTEKRLFVPSSKYHTSVAYKPNIVPDTTTTPSTTRPTTTAFKLKTRKLPMTSAKLNKIHSAPESTTKMPEQAVLININEIFGFGAFDKKNGTEVSDGPFKMTIDLEEMVTAQGVQDEENIIQTRTFSPVKITTPRSLASKLKNVTAKEEIMEILNNPIEKETLSRILRSRNMTVEQLVQQRERGSSQLHLADIFHNKTLEPEPKDEPFIGHIHQPDSINKLSFFNRKAKTIPLVVEDTTQTSPKPEIEIAITKLPYTITSFPTYKIETNKDVKIQPFLPLWQQLYPSFFTDVYENNHSPEKKALLRPSPVTTEKIDYEELERLEEIENALAEAANGRLKVDLPDNVYDEGEEEEFINLPSGVKSAILASLAIIGLSLLVFLTILVIFKWSQKQKGRLNYNSSFSGSRIRSPILEPDQRRTFRTFMSETLGKKKNYYKAHLQRMSDSIWDKEERKSYMI